MAQQEPTQTPIERAKAIFQAHSGVLTTTEATRRGIHPDILYTMRDAGDLEQLSRGLYRLADLPPLEHPDLVTVALRVPHGVLCLISALALHDITTEVPHEIYLALERGVTRPRIEEVPLRTFWFSEGAYREGIETHHLDGISVRVYSPEKTLADCFKYRNKLGMETVLEALRLYRQRKSVKVDSLVNYARICRVERVMRPYLEAVLT